MNRIALWMCFVSTTAWAQGSAHGLSVRETVRAALEARAELPQSLPQLPLFTELRPASSLQNVHAKDAAADRNVAPGLERAQKAREKALERLEKQLPPGLAKKANPSAVSEDARQAKSSERIPGPPAGKGKNKKVAPTP